MLFALNLNADAALETSEYSDGCGLSEYRIGNVLLRFCRSPSRPLLMVVFAEADAGGAVVAHLASVLLDSFEATFHDELAAMEDAFPRRAIRRQAFAASLRSAVGALPGFLCDSMFNAAVEAAENSAEGLHLPSSKSQYSRIPSLRLEVDSIAILHSCALCAALERPPPGGTSDVTGSVASTRRGHKAAARNQLKQVEPLLRSLLGLHADESAPQKSGGSWLACCGFAQLAPHPSALPAAPLLWSRNAGEPLSASTTTASADAATGHQLVKELSRAWRDAALTGAHARYSRAVLSEGLPSGFRLRPSEPTTSLIIVLLHSPAVLRVRILLHGIDANAAELAPHVVTAMASALQPWLAPLSLALEFLDTLSKSTMTTSTAKIVVAR